METTKKVISPLMFILIIVVAFIVIMAVSWLIMFLFTRFFSTITGNKDIGEAIGFLVSILFLILLFRLGIVSWKISTK